MNYNDLDLGIINEVLGWKLEEALNTGADLEAAKTFSPSFVCEVY
mgnify:CR=1 FL=1